MQNTVTTMMHNITILGSAFKERYGPFSTKYNYYYIFNELFSNPVASVGANDTTQWHEYCIA